jgi:hypothetical protein
VSAMAKDHDISVDPGVDQPTRLQGRERLISQTLLTCPHCGDDFLLNEASDGAISVERVEPTKTSQVVLGNGD